MISKNKIKVIILAAGKGTRMNSSKPKVLHEILGKTLVERVIDNVLKLADISGIYIVVGHQADLVTNFINKIYKSSNCPIDSILQQPQLGTGDAVFKVYDNLKQFDGTVLVLCGDTPLLKSETISDFWQSHKQSGAAVTVMSAIFDSPKNYGRIVRDSNGSIKKIVEEKDASQEEKNIKEINAGVYCLEWNEIAPAFFDLTTNNNQGEYYLTDIIDWAVKKNLKAEAYILDDKAEVFGINSRSDLAQAAAMLNKRTLESLMENGITIIDPQTTWISPETLIGKDTVVYPGTIIEGENEFGEECILGPDLYIGGGVKASDNVKIFQSRVSHVLICRNSTIGPFAHIRDNVIINNNVRIGNFVEVKNSTVNESTNIAHLSYIGDSILGKNVNIGAGTITANYNPLTKQKNKTIIEDNVKVGSNSVLVAPVTVSANANVAAGSVITKDVPEGSLAIARGKQTIIENWVNKKIKEQLKIEV